LSLDFGIRAQDARSYIHLLTGAVLLAILAIVLDGEQRHDNWRS
jgi:hypothetical protein